MPLDTIADIIRSGLSKSDFTDSLKFDCGPAGTITLDNGQVSLEDLPAACTLKMSVENLEKLVKGKLNPMTAVMMGKNKVGGDPSVAMKLGRLLKG
ncbi:SCP2 sterol-binding domain-containing protein [Tropicimonas sp. TH_r6]|uniref:SCP2 sterol-binding domain-containing protein n=1 Tax=Tropicimonas sp. TH_r6 TaxID=3082085 RepID=UPI0029545F5F|nr:SCP2 sterol-binding domain-containing protein [Tropicimonas sp. TH_r6]MDV7144606.1 SCP2 sterol-binding domain-containing protein [Tropicimonas sp. TH_r6]